MCLIFRPADLLCLAKLQFVFSFFFHDTSHTQIFIQIISWSLKIFCLLENAVRIPKKSAPRRRFLPLCATLDVD